jgi:hypothetical protein
MKTYAVLLAAALWVSSAGASECTQDAKGGLRDCKTGCKEDFQVAKDNCNNKDHDCMELCRANRDQCREDSGIDQAIAQCQADLASARAVCRQQNPAGSTALDHCIDQAQIVAFQCRDAAREKAKPALVQCRKTFRGCARACPPADPNAPAIDVPACRLQAKQDAKTCVANCREDFQVTKDACQNRDHGCVEGCRALRDMCTDPILTTLAGKIAMCNADRDADIATCHQLYPLPSQAMALDQCIDDAQVAAFVCRDDARETARTDLVPCRQNFLSCAKGCPPASSPSAAFLGE